MNITTLSAKKLRSAPDLKEEFQAVQAQPIAVLGGADRRRAPGEPAEIFVPTDPLTRTRGS